MSNDLIERLRTNNCDNLYEFSLRKEAAKALEAKDKEIELLEKGYDALLDDRNEAWERVAELEAALRDMFALIDEGFLCRDISRDAESGWAIKQLGFVQRLAKANQALGESDE